MGGCGFDLGPGHCESVRGRKEVGRGRGTSGFLQRYVNERLVWVEDVFVVE